MNDQNMKPRGSLVWPLVLIGIGVIFLLSNLGVVDWAIWPTVLRLWPLLLVAVGLDLLLGRRSGIWAGITIAIVIGMFAGGIWLVNTTTGVWAGELVTHEVYQELDGEKYATVYISMGVGALEIDSLASDSVLVSGSIEVAEAENVQESFQSNGSTADYFLSTHGQEYYPSWLLNENNKSEKDWRLSLSSEVILDLVVDCGVGVSEVDARELKLSTLSVDSGVGETTVYLPESGQYVVTIDAGVGQVTVFIPAGIEVQMTVDTGLGNTIIPNHFRYQNGVYTTVGFDNAKNYVELSIDGGVGEIVVIQDN